MRAIMCFAFGAFGLFMLFMAVSTPGTPDSVYVFAIALIALIPLGVALGNHDRCPKCGKWNGRITEMSRRPYGNPDQELERITHGCSGCDYTETEIRKVPPEDPFFP
jgi:hypothetical protein